MRDAGAAKRWLGATRVRLRAAGRRIAAKRAPDRLHRAGTARARPKRSDARGVLRRVSCGNVERGEPLAPARRYGHKRSVRLALGIRRSRSRCGPDAVRAQRPRRAARREREARWGTASSHRNARHDGHRHAPSSSGSKTASASQTPDWEQRVDPAARVTTCYRNADRARRVSARLSRRVRPLHGPAAVGRDDPQRATLLPAADAPDKRDLGLNGTYVVLRDLRQDVRAFWRYARRRRGRRGSLAPSNSRPRSSAARATARRSSQHADQNAVSTTRAIPTACAVRSAHTSGARTHATRTTRAARTAPSAPSLLPSVRPARAARGPDVAGALSPDRPARPRVRRGVDARAGACADAPRRRRSRARLRFICINASILRQFEFVRTRG